MDKGLVHLYWGEGKGKTTAAAGLALRALGNGLRVTFVQFLKSGRSRGARAAPKARARRLYRQGRDKIVFQMTPEEKPRRKRCTMRICGRRWNSPAICWCWMRPARPAGWIWWMRPCCAVPCWSARRSARSFLTGREPAVWMLESADYSTEMVCRRHPYQSGIAARKGVEF